ncbi:MAG: hypothetical protein AAGI52_15230 [Bacteroidota bacterium]
MPDLKCHFCGSRFALSHLLARPRRYWRALDLVQCELPCCGEMEDLRISDGVVERGYVYAAGAPHFAPMETIAAPDLRVFRTADGLRYTLGADSFETPSTV